MQRASQGLRLSGLISNWRSFNQDQAPDDAMAAVSRESSQSTTADSSPVSPTFGDVSRHSRMPSSNSSISSSPIPGDSLDGGFSTRKTLLEGLPEVDEERVEREMPFERARSAELAHQPQPNHTSWNYDSPKMRPASYFMASTDRADHYGSSSDNEGHWAKRRRSGDFAWNSFATGITSKFPSISKRSREKKRASFDVADSYYQRSSPPASSPPASLRHSSSFRRSLSRRSAERDTEQDDSQKGLANIETIMEDDFREPTMDEFEFHDFQGGETQEDFPLPPQDGMRSTTPILPPLMDNLAPATVMLSPLQSPTVAMDDLIPSVSHTPDSTPQLSAGGTPVLSAKPSIASIHRSRASTVVPSTEIPPLVMADPNDEWAEKLGHANFQITPEPYIPDTCDEFTCETLMKDWETARGEFAKHLSRTEMHFGRSSRTLKLTEEKWSFIDAQWAANNDVVSRRAAASGRIRHPSPKQPAPVARIPPVDDPRLIQSEDIPGPMTIDEPAKPQLGRRPSKRAQLRKLIGNFQFPSPTMGRSASAAGSH